MFFNFFLLFSLILITLFFKSNFGTGGQGRGRFHGIGPDISGRPKDPELQFKSSSNSPQFYILMG
jgi:hypothetical protein